MLETNTGKRGLAVTSLVEGKESMSRLVTMVENLVGSGRRNDQYSDQFLFILGCGRSGNTLVRKELVKKFAIFIPAETYVIPRAIEAFRKSERLSWSERICLTVSIFEYQDEFHTLSKSGLGQVVKKCEGLIGEQKTFGNIMAELWAHFSREAEIPYTLAGDKTPLNTLSLRMLARSFPKANFLFLSRCPIDVCYSYIKMGRYSDVESAAIRWKRSHEAWLGFRRWFPFRDAHLVRYEDLVSSPLQVISSIGDWLGVAKRAEPLGNNVFWGDVDTYAHHTAVLHEINAYSVGKGTRNLSTDEKKAVKAIVGSLANKFGYSL